MFRVSHTTRHPTAETMGSTVRMPSSRMGNKVVHLAESATGYVLNMIPHTGKNATKCYS